MTPRKISANRAVDSDVERCRYVERALLIDTSCPALALARSPAAHRLATVVDLARLTPEAAHAMASACTTPTTPTFTRPS